MGQFIYNGWANIVIVAACSIWVTDDSWNCNQWFGDIDVSGIGEANVGAGDVKVSPLSYIWKSACLIEA